MSLIMFLFILPSGISGVLRETPQYQLYYRECGYVVHLNSFAMEGFLQQKLDTIIRHINCVT